MRKVWSTLWKPWLVLILFVWIGQDSPKEKVKGIHSVKVLSEVLKLFSLPIAKILRITTHAQYRKAYGE